MRELIEETGFRDVPLSGPVFTRRHVFVWNGEEIDQRETFFVARVSERTEVASAFTSEQLEAEGIFAQRWWSLDELDGVVTAPEDLVERVRAL